MIVLPDVNILVYAFRRESLLHDLYRSWLADLVGGAGELALEAGTLTGFLRIVTNPRIYGDPAPTTAALAFVTTVRRARRGRWVSGSDAVWTRFRSLVDADAQIRGNLVPDAWLAALAMGHGCHIATADRGFARFAGLDHFDPARS